jgi:hypothetical protein
MISLSPDTIMAVDVKISDDTLSVEFADGREICVPLGCYPRLVYATTLERNLWRLTGGGIGIHGPDVVEDVSVAGLFTGRPSAETQISSQRWLAKRVARVT